MSDAERKAILEARAKLGFSRNLVQIERVASKTRLARLCIEVLHRMARGTKLPDEAAEWLMRVDPETDPAQVAKELRDSVKAINEYVDLIISHLTKEPKK